jgi:hypothetical protein
MNSLDEFNTEYLSEFENNPYPSFDDDDGNNYLNNSVNNVVKSKIFIDEQIKKIIPGINNTSVNGSKSSTAETQKNKIFNIEKVKEKKNILQKKRGRKKTNEKSERKHNNTSEDNMITKIKIQIFEYAMHIINQNLPENKQLIKLNHNKVRKLQIDLNTKMFDKTLRQLFSEINKSKKYKDQKYEDNNKKIINEIDEGIIKAEKVKKILDLTFFELLEIFKKKKEEIISDDELDELNLLVGKKMEKKSGFERFIKKLKDKFSDDYIMKISSLIFKYKEWFDGKTGRKKSYN